GYTELSDQQAALQRRQGKAVTALDAATAAAVKELGSGIGGAVKQENSASRLLSGELKDVLTDLGSPSSGEGLLGDIASRSGQVGVGHAQVGQATAST